ncbi:T6SS immunity protein Tli3 family protein [Thiosocius teredinicola]|uniref:T6SS immunity protein Tli3 family protein n=1 Tax=Thiosocius teredinicola TaxID=1973002 RepID=UPI000990C118
METAEVWIVSIWTLLFSSIALLVSIRTQKKALAALGILLAVAAIVPILPAGQSSSRNKPATQVIYRFDDHRHLELTGYGCEGAIYYADEKHGVRTAYIDQFARVFLPDIVHADDDGDFVFLPYSDASGFLVSKDQGRTFNDARWIGTRPWAREITRITVAGRQAFIEVQDGRLFMTSNPADNDRWGMGVIDPVNVLPNKVHRDYPEWQNLPTEVPPVENYKGWTQMRCDPDLLGEPMETAGTRWNRFQQQVSDVLARTIALPVTWAVEYFG